MDFLYKDSCLLKESDILKTAESLGSYIKKLNEIIQTGDYDSPETAIKLPFDEELTGNIRNVKTEKASPQLKYLVVFGIGGSNLSTKAVYDALLGYFDTVELGRLPKIIFADSTDPEYLMSLKDLLLSVKEPEELLINIVSKSGTTTEVIVDFEFIVGELERKFENIKERVVVTTDKKSKLWQAAEKKGLALLRIPEKVGGRDSVMSSVGMFPLSMIGINTNSLCQGAQKITKACLEEEVSKNPAALSAAITYLHLKGGRAINDNFFFHAELESLGKWLRQMVAESLGKDGEGITPTVSIGPRDLHSVGQLYLGGPDDKLTTFIWTKALSRKPALPKELFLPNLVKNIEGKSLGQVSGAIAKSVHATWRKKKLPFVEVLLSDISPTSLGQFMQFKMIETMYLGKLMGVDAFNQPDVESYKSELRKLI
jgi:glucose-6-phosphate isomerase